LYNMYWDVKCPTINPALQNNNMHLHFFNASHPTYSKTIIIYYTLD
jgi:hypothetical protein